MPHTTTASVIVLGCDGKDFLPDCLTSVLDQSYAAEDYEVIYADNASIDGSADLVAEGQRTDWKMLDNLGGF